MLFCHQINYIFRINALLSRNFVVPIYALFPPIFLCSKVDHRQFVRFLDVCLQSPYQHKSDPNSPNFSLVLIWHRLLDILVFMVILNIWGTEQRSKVCWISLWISVGPGFKIETEKVLILNSSTRAFRRDAMEETVKKENHQQMVGQWTLESFVRQCGKKWFGSSLQFFVIWLIPVLSFWGGICFESSTFVNIENQDIIWSGNGLEEVEIDFMWLSYPWPVAASARICREI